MSVSYKRQMQALDVVRLAAASQRGIQRTTTALSLMHRDISCASAVLSPGSEQSRGQERAFFEYTADAVWRAALLLEQHGHHINGFRPDADWSCDCLHDASCYLHRMIAAAYTQIADGSPADELFFFQIANFAFQAVRFGVQKNVPVVGYVVRRHVDG